LLLRDLSGLFLLFIIQIILISAGFLILVISLLILSNLINCNISPRIVHRGSHRNITLGTLHKILFAICFVPIIFAFIYFIMPIFLFQSDPYFKLFDLVIISLYCIGFWVFLFIVSIFNSSISPPNKTIFSIILIIALVVGLVSLGGTAISLISQFSPTVNLTNNSTEIISSNISYSISNASTLGIPLQGGGYVTMSDMDKKYYLNAHWTTNFGYFISSDPEKHITKIEGSDFSIDNGYSMIYWTYDPKYQGIKKPPVFIFLTVTNIRKDEVVGVSQLNITWSDIDTAHVGNN